MTWAKEISGHRQALASTFAILGRTPHEALLWVTTVVAAFVVTLDDDAVDDVRAAIDAYKIERSSIYKRSGRTYRSPRGWTRYCGTIEYDLIHPMIARKCSTTKTGLLAELGVDVAALRSDQRVLVVHEHAVVDHRGHPSARAFLQDLRCAWPGARRVHAAHLHKDGTVGFQLGRLADYAGKFRFRYSSAWNGKRTSYLCDYEHEWREFMRDLYRRVGFQKLLSANVTTQASDARMHTRPVDFVGEMALYETVQLCIPSSFRTEDEFDVSKPASSQASLGLVKPELKTEDADAKPSSRKFDAEPFLDVSDKTVLSEDKAHNNFMTPPDNRGYASDFSTPPPPWIEESSATGHRLGLDTGWADAAEFARNSVETATPGPTCRRPPAPLHGSGFRVGASRI